MATNALYGVAAGTDYNLAFSAPTALYDGLATELGLTKFDSAAEKSKVIIVEAAKFLLRVRVSYQATGKTRSGALWASRDKKFTDLKTALSGKNFRSYPIESVGQPLDASRH